MSNKYQDNFDHSEGRMTRKKTLRQKKEILRKKKEVKLKKWKEIVMNELNEELNR